MEKSLGDASGFEIAVSRAKLLKVAAGLGVRVPDTVVVESEADIASAMRKLGPIAVMKLDGTHGGEGVRVVCSEKEAIAAFRTLRRSTGLMTALHRHLIYSDPLSGWSWTRRDRSQIVLQEYVDGKPANNMVACWRGEVLGEISVECVSCQGSTGSASVVRRIDRPEFKLAAQLLAGHLQASGFFGLDFMIERASGKAYLIEMNPRCTQLGHLRFPPHGDLAGALCRRLAGRSTVPPEAAVGSSAIDFSTIALFPQAWTSSAAADERSRAFQDIPWEEPSLIKYLMQPPWPERRVLARVYRLARGRKS
jgi:predicted ATP-grasp superfamily ATP-dependent carboligase